jgi:hypothetical protein
MPIISEANWVNVSDSNLSNAGGNVNNIEVHVTVSNQPSESTSLWSKILGEWLLRLVPTSPLPSVVPSTPQEEAVEQPPTAPPCPPPLSDGSVDIVSGSLRLTMQRISTSHVQVPLNHAHMYERLAIPAVPMREPHEIYVRQLYPHGYGYPCANPMPWDKPLQIGDIGLLESDGFIVLESLYTLPGDFIIEKSTPVVPVMQKSDFFMEGDTITGGVQRCEIKTSRENPGYASHPCFQTRALKQLTRDIDEIVIHRLREEGAVLAITSPTVLDQLRWNDDIRDYLCRYASRLFEYLSKRHSLPNGTSLYVVTGTILSASWATATYEHPTGGPSYDSMVLKRVAAPNSPYYMWTDKGNAQTRTQGRQLRDKKDQCLFLKGFLLDASPDFWKAHREKLRLENEHGETPHTQTNDRQHRQGVRGPNASEESSHQRIGGGSNSVSLDHPAQVFSGSSSDGQSKITIHAIPSYGSVASDYPSSRVNKALLELVSQCTPHDADLMRGLQCSLQTKAEIAITHDDDWGEAVMKAGKAHPLLEVSEG